MDASNSELISPNQSQGEKKQRRSWRELLSQGLHLIAIAWLAIMLLELAVLYRYAWQKGIYPKPGAPSSPTHGPWAYDLFLEQGIRSLFDPPFYALVFAVLSLIVKPSMRAGISLFLSIFLLFIAFGHIGLAED